MLQTRTVEPRTLGLLKSLMEMPSLADHFLVGGTALALQLGHRFSVDIDLFSGKPFEHEILLEALRERYSTVQPLTVTNTIFISLVEEIKVDCVHFRYPLAHPLAETDGIRLADLRDIAPMKLDAVTKRGSKKDFFDMFYLFEKFAPTDILGWYSQMFKHSTSFHVVRSLTWFEDAEKTENPMVFDRAVTWEVVKKRIREVVRDHF